MNLRPNSWFLALGLLAALALTLSFTGCKSEPKESKESAKSAITSEKVEEVPDSLLPAAATSMADEDWLLLIEYLPLGESYDDIKGRFTALGQDLPEGKLKGLHDYGMTSAKLRVKVLDHDEILEFNFKYDTLRSYFFVAAKLDTASATGLWGYLHEYYVAHFGDSRDEEQHEREYYLNTAMWDTDRFDIVLSLMLRNSGEARVVWGFQDAAANGR